MDSDDQTYKDMPNTVLSDGGMAARKRLAEGSDGRGNDTGAAIVGCEADEARIAQLAGPPGVILDRVSSGGIRGGGVGAALLPGSPVVPLHDYNLHRNHQQHNIEQLRLQATIAEAAMSPRAVLLLPNLASLVDQGLMTLDEFAKVKQQLLYNNPAEAPGISATAPVLPSLPTTSYRSYAGTVSGRDIDDVTAWLQAIQLSAYATQFKELGYEHMHDLKQLQPHELARLLQEIPMKPGHEQRFRNRLQAISRTPSDSTPAAAADSIAIRSSGESDVVTEELRVANRAQDPVVTSKGMPRLMTAQKAILSAQCSVLACATLLTVVLIVMPTYVFGSIYGTMSTTDGLLVIAPFLIYTKFAPAHALMRFVQEQTFAECIKSEPQWRLTPRWRNFWVAFSFFKCMCLAEVHVSTVLPSLFHPAQLPGREPSLGCVRPAFSCLTQR